MPDDDKIIQVDDDWKAEAGADGEAILAGNVGLLLSEAAAAA